MQHITLYWKFLRKFQQIVLNNLSDIDFEDFMKLYKDYTKKSYSVLVNNTTLSSDNLLRFYLRTYYKNEY